MKEIVLKVDKISKQYRLGEIGTGTISHDINRWWSKLRGKGDPYLKVGQLNDRSEIGGDFVWALRDINFDVQKGEVLGIIGRNGAGKSTLLKLLSKVTSPTEGVIKYKGRMASLLEVGTGFHPELTGRENVFLNGAILGMTKSEIRSKMDEIVDFSGCAKYIDTPVKRYSSGMKVRLGFAVAAHLEPEILVVDEVLAVGDAEFQKKCIGKMQDVAGEGRTVLFVSHNMSSVRNLCTKAIVLDKGKMVFEGETEEAINKYLTLNVDLSQIDSSYSCLDKPDDSNYVKEVKVNFPNNKTKLDYSDNLSISFTFNYPNKNRDVFLGVVLEDDKGNYISVNSTDEVEKNPFAEIPENENNLNIIMNFPKKILKPGDYFITFSFREKQDVIYHRVEKAISFSVEDLTTFKGMKNRYRPNSIISPDIKWENDF